MPRKVILGSEEWCSFPELGIPNKSSSQTLVQISNLHAINIPFGQTGFDLISSIQNNLKTVIH
jgi:ribosomal protein S6--L-glutamate ligase